MGGTALLAADTTHFRGLSILLLSHTLHMGNLLAALGLILHHMRLPASWLLGRGKS